MDLTKAIRSQIAQRTMTSLQARKGFNPRRCSLFSTEQDESSDASLEQNILCGKAHFGSRSGSEAHPGLLKHSVHGYEATIRQHAFATSAKMSGRERVVDTVIATQLEKLLFVILECFKSR